MSSHRVTLLKAGVGRCVANFFTFTRATVIERTKTILKHISVAQSGLCIQHKPNYVLAAGVYLAIRHTERKKLNLSEGNLGDITNQAEGNSIDPMLKLLSLEKNGVRAYAKLIQACRDFLKEPQNRTSSRSSTGSSTSISAVVHAHKNALSSFSTSMPKRAEQASVQTPSSSDDDKMPKQKHKQKRSSKESRIRKIEETVGVDVKKVLPEEVVRQLATHREERERNERRKEKKRRLSEGATEKNLP